MVFGVRAPGHGGKARAGGSRFSEASTTMNCARTPYLRLAVVLFVVGGAFLFLAHVVERSGSEAAVDVPVMLGATEIGVGNLAEAVSSQDSVASDSLPLAHVLSPTDVSADATPFFEELFSCDARVDMTQHFCQRGWSVDRLSPLNGRILVGLYGTPLGRGLGILGTVSPSATVTLAREQAEAYQIYLTDTTVTPYFHMVTTIADAFPGDDGDYNHRVMTATIQFWIEVARSHGVLVVLDIQTGHSLLSTELDYVKPFLQQQGVHLALDPEFAMRAGAIPGEVIGRMDAEDVNQTQAWLSERAWDAGERKILILHQFDDRMFEGKERIRSFQSVEIVWDADGFGGPPAKIADYYQYASEPGFEYGGFKLFYGYDQPLMTPADVLRLNPRPAVIVYQ